MSTEVLEKTENFNPCIGRCSYFDNDCLTMEKNQIIVCFWGNDATNGITDGYCPVLQNQN